jgi:hypothetical protein
VAGNLMIKATTAALVLLFLPIAAAAEPLTRDSSRSPAMGYVGGDFALREIGEENVTAFIITNEDTNKEYTLPFLTTKPSVKVENKATVLVALPPGTYKVTQWVVYSQFWGNWWGGREVKKEVSQGRIAEPFTLAAGEVIFLGRFVATNKFSANAWVASSYDTVQEATLSENEARALLSGSYPNFSAASVTCIDCVQASPEALPTEAAPADIVRSRF